MPEAWAHSLALVVGAAALLLVIASLPFYSKDTPADVARAIERFLEVGRTESREFDEYLGIRARDPKVNELKERAYEIDRAHASDDPPFYTTEAGLQALRHLAAEIRKPLSRPTSGCT